MTDSELQRQMATFQRCIEERDADAARAVLDDDYALVLVHPTLVVMPREQWLEVLPEYVVHRYALHERRVDIDGDCACVLQRAEMQATVLGEDRSGQFVITDIWRRRGSAWRVWRRHSTGLAAGRMPGAQH
ncbi:MAG: nuclear transport factor 2 family protein [Actinobacteria bacterium]|nr:nuclear transport factor 2 family protein [Actinomycetota bacterium]